MRYAVLLYADADLDAGPGAPAWEASLPAHVDFATRLNHAGIEFTGGALHAVRSATTLRRRDGEVLRTDGPFAETKEQLWGYYAFEAPDVDAVVSLVDGLWELDNGAVEIRPLIPASGGPAG